MTVVIVSTVPEHLTELVENIRDKDRKEIIALGQEPLKGLIKAYEKALYAKTALIDNKVAACWGVCGSVLSGKGIPFLITTSEVYKISPTAFVRIYKKEVKEMLNIFDYLENYVDASYSEAIRVLALSGFTVDSPEKIGPNKILFCKFYKATS